MQDNKILTISIASYNVEKTLGETLESLICDEETMKRLEVLIVNDGSKDGTADVAGRYTAGYPETFRLINKENGGHGSTLNTAVGLAAGRYFRMLDGDDWAVTSALPDIVAALQAIDADLVLTPYIKVYGDREVPVDAHPLEAGRLYDVAGLDGRLISDVTAHEMTIRTELLRGKGVRMSERCFYTDMELIFFSLMHTKTIAKLDKAFYRYRLGVSGQSASVAGRVKHWEDARKIERRLVEAYMQNSGEMPEPVRQTLYDMIFSFGIYQYQNLVLLRDSGEAARAAAGLEAWLKEYPDFYRALGSSRLVSFLRATGFGIMRPIRGYVERHL